MGRLALIWDGTWLTWTTFDATPDVGRREISRPHMVQEVLRALRKQVGAGAEVLHAEWGQPATAIPMALMPPAPSAEDVTPLHALHHGRSKAGTRVAVHGLDGVLDTPWLALSEDDVWQEAVAHVFPQARPLPLVRVLVHDAIQWHRREAGEAWTFRADVRPEGALLVGVDGESLQWVHHLCPGCTSEDALYAMVNAAHRGGVDVNACRVQWSGDKSLTQGWDRFVLQAPHPHDSQETPAKSWWPLLSSMNECG